MLAYRVSWASGSSISFRMLSWLEFQQAQILQVGRAERDLWVYETVRIDGPSSSDVPFGVVAWLGQYLIEESPFGGSPAVIQKFQRLASNWLQSNFLEQARGLIAGTFRYSFEEIEKWDQEVFFQRLAAAEMLIGKKMVVGEAPAAAAPVSEKDELQRQHELREQQKTQLRKQLRDRTNRRR